jgi:predicted DNA-binding antitoxin AbrB/MazE fold protein
MSQFVDAIYENGILRPLTPLALPEHSRVALTVQELMAATDAGDLAKQQAALDAMFREVDALPQEVHADGLSGRDHDQILYGTSK